MSLPLLFRFGDIVPVWRQYALFLFTGAYLCGQTSAALGWLVSSPLWIGGLLTSASLAFLLCSYRTGVWVSCLLVTFFAANLTLHRVTNPRLPADHLHNLSLPQEVPIDGWVFREPDRFPYRGRLYLEAQRLWQHGAPRPATGKILLTVRSLTGSWQYGDVLHLTLKLRTPRNFHTPGSFDYEGF